MELIDTPNPNAKKIVFDQNVLDEINLHYHNALSEDLYKIEGVSSVFFWS